MTTEVAPAGPTVETAAAGAPPVEAQPAAAPPDQAFTTGNAPAAPETTPPGPPETQAPAAGAETPPETPPKKSLDELTEEELAEDPRVKSLTARSTESERRRLEREQIDREAALARQYRASDAFVQDFEGEIRRAAASVDEQGNVELDRNKVDSMFRHLLTAGAEEATSTIGRLLGAEVGESFTPTAEEQELLRAAQSEYNRDPIRNADALARQWLRMRDRAVLETKTAELRTQIEREVRQELNARAEETRARETREQTQAQGGPTATSNTPAPPQWRSQQQIDNAHAREGEPGGISTEAYRQLIADGTYHRLPPR